MELEDRVSNSSCKYAQRSRENYEYRSDLEALTKETNGTSR